MITTRFLILNKPAFLSVAGVAIMSFCFSLIVASQPAKDLSRLQAKYPGSFVIAESVTRDVIFEIARNGNTKSSFSDHEAIFVLADNATALSESKEYFNSQLEVIELQAYSLVPAGNAYKRQTVTDFTKAHETGDGVYYDDLYTYLFNFPSVGKGSRLVTTSQTVSTDPFYPVVFYFGGNIPVEQAKLTLTFPEDVSVSHRMFGYDTSSVSFSKTKKGRNYIYTWSGGSSKSYLADELSPSSRYFTPHVIINIDGYTHQGTYHKILGSLKDLYDWDYSKIVNVNTEISPEVKQLTDSITANLNSDKDKVGRIFRWVQQNIKYVAIEDGDNGQIPRQASLVLSRRYGDCKDKSSLLTAMIRSVGLNSNFAWVGTRKLPYKYSDFPALSNSNHMIAVWWDEHDKPVILDGTTLYHSLEEIPSTIQGKECVIEKGPDNFLLYEIPVSKADENISTDSVWISINDGLLKGNGKATFTGEPKSTLLASFEGIDSAAYINIMNKLLPKASNKCKYTAVQISSLDKLDQPLTVIYNFELPDYITANSSSSYVNMNIQRYMNDTKLKADRWIPVELDTPFINRFVSILKIPDHTDIGNLPEISSFNQQGLNFSQQYSRAGNTIILTSEITALNRSFSGDAISSFRNLLIAINKAYNKSIVLTRN